MSVFLLLSCQQNKYNTYCYVPIPVSGWERDSIITIPLDTIRENGIYEMSVGVRSYYGYPYKYLWLQISTEIYCPGWKTTDTLKCNITDENGRYLGAGLNIFEKQYFLKETYLKKGQYGFVRIKQIMRRNPLPGVSDIGLSLKKERK